MTPTRGESGANRAPGSGSGSAGLCITYEQLFICHSLTPHAVDGLTEIFRVLGDPTRVRILDALSRRELCVGDLASQLGVTESAVSHQLRLLRNTRIVRARRAGRMMFYALDDKHVLALFRQGLRHVQEGRPRRPRAMTRRRHGRRAPTCELHAEAVFRVEGMDCNEEVVILERRLKPLAGIEAMSADVDRPAPAREVRRRQADHGRDGRCGRPDRHAHVARARGAARRRAPTSRRRVWLTLASGAALAAGLAADWRRRWRRPAAAVSSRPAVAGGRLSGAARGRRASDAQPSTSTS